MNKKDYQKPAIRSVGMQHRTQMILISGPVNAKRNSYGTANQSVGTGAGISYDTNGRWVWSNE